VFTAMPRMLRELSRDPAGGLKSYQLLSGSPRTYYVVQYWESKEKLLAYAADPDRLHRGAWAAMNRRMLKSRQHVGIWHETYVVPAGGYESIYGDMPAYGLAAATGVLPLERRGATARERLAHAAAQTE
jgi:heme-degrading monooxygenase HmoA